MKNISDFTKSAMKSLAFASLSLGNAYFLADGSNAYGPEATKLAMLLGVGFSAKHYSDAIKSYLKTKKEQESKQ